MKTSAFATILRSNLLPCALAIVAGAPAVPAMAQTGSTVATMSVPFAFYIDNQKMPAGVYRIDRETSTLFELRGPDGSGMVLTHPIAAKGEIARGNAAFHRVGGSYFLEGFWPGGEAAGWECPESHREKKQMQDSKRQVPSLTTLAFDPGIRH